MIKETTAIIGYLYMMGTLVAFFVLAISKGERFVLLAPVWPVLVVRTIWVRLKEFWHEDRN